MAPPIVLPIDAGLAINGFRLSDHNRSEISITPERLENRKRMADGTRRVFFVAQKRKIKTGWTDLPAQDIRTADGFWGAKSLIGFHNSEVGEFTLTVTYGDESTEDILVMFEDFSHNLSKRGPYTDLYNIEVSFEEV